MVRSKGHQLTKSVFKRDFLVNVSSSNLNLSSSNPVTFAHSGYVLSFNKPKSMLDTEHREWGLFRPAGTPQFTPLPVMTQNMTFREEGILLDFAQRVLCKLSF